MSGEITPEEASRIAALLKAFEGTYELLEARDLCKQLQRLDVPSSKKTFYKFTQE